MGVKISALPAAASAALANEFAAVQSGVTRGVTLQQVLTLFDANIQIAESQVTNLVTDLAAKLNLAGGTMTGGLILNADPVADLESATKQYVDSIAEGLHFHQSCVAGTTANLAGYTYDNGTAGVGATLTAGGNGAFSTDGVSPSLNDRILVSQQSTGFQNGIYTLTQVGDGSNPAILTRATDYDEPDEIDVGDAFIIQSGTAYSGTMWFQTATVATIGVDSIVFSLTNSAANINAGTGLSKTGNTINLDNPVDPSLGGTGIDNGTSTMTIGDDFEMSGAFTFVGTVTGATTVTYPTSGTLATVAQVDARINEVVSQVFTSNGTYTPTATTGAGMLFCIAEVVGGGGGGGGSTGGAALQAAAGGGGGGGGYALEVIDAATIGASQTVTVGAAGAAGASGGGTGGTGGTTSLGALLSATGGAGGVGSAADGGVAWYSMPGAGGLGSGGDVNIAGSHGQPGLIFGTRTAGRSGNGGSAHYAGEVGGVNAESAGATGNASGGGGSGGVSFTVDQAGGAGAAGTVIITEFLAT